MALALYPGLSYLRHTRLLVQNGEKKNTLFNVGVPNIEARSVQCTLKVAKAHPDRSKGRTTGHPRYPSLMAPILPEATIQNGSPVRKCGTAEIFAPMMADVLRINTMDSFACRDNIQDNDRTQGHHHCKLVSKPMASPMAPTKQFDAYRWRGFRSKTTQVQARINPRKSL